MTDQDTNKVSDEMLMALADGELDENETRALRSRIDRDPDLSARYAVYAETADAMRAAFSQDGVPERLIRAAKTAPGQPANGASPAPFPARRLAWPLALAASLALGVGLGWGLKGGYAPDSAPRLKDVAQRVSDMPTGQTKDVDGVGTARVLGSFETDRGFCRLIAVEPTGAAPGRFVACREAEGWEVALSVSNGSGDGFTPASEIGTEMIDLYLDSIGAGTALDQRTELEGLR